MSLITELRAKSDNAENIKKEVIEEIQSYFDQYLNNGGLENYLRRRIGNTEIKERKVFMRVEFWEYHAGCSTTYFHCGGKDWYNPENEDGASSWEYRGVELRTIDKEVCSYLSTRLRKRMDELGFKFLYEETPTNRLGYYDKHFYFGW